MAESRRELETGSGELVKQCDACRNAGETKTANVFCKSCRQFQFETCSSMHTRLPRLSDHSDVDIRDIEEAKVVDMKGVDNCKTHSSELKFYCKTHDMLCCDKCIVNAHLKCNDVGELGEFTQSNDELLNGLQRRIQAKLFTINIDKSTIPRVKASLRKGLEEEINGKITQAFKLMMKEFRSKADKAIADTCKQLDSKMEQNRKLLETLRSTKTYLNNVATTGTSEQKFNALCTISQDLDKLPLKDQEPLKTCKIKITFNKKLAELSEITDQIAKISIEKMEVYAPLTLNSAVFIDVPQTQGGKTPLISGLDFLNDGRIVAVDICNDKIYIFENMTNQKLVSTCTIKVKKPLDVTVMSGDRVAISHGKVIAIFKVNPDNSLNQLNHIITKEFFYSVSAVDDQTLIGGTCNTDAPANLVTLKGEVKGFDVPLPRKRYVFDQSRSTYISSLNMFILTDRQSNKCHLWNVKDGTGVVVEDDRIKSPRGVCATSSGDIFICCHDNRMIVQLSPTGKVINSTSVTSNRSAYLTSVTVSRDGKKLVVCILNNQKRNCKLKMYSLT